MTCGTCGQPLTGRDQVKYCSHACAAESRRGKANCNFNGGLSRMGSRTIIVHRDGKHWTLYYRALMEAHLRRPLRPEEVVHHVNGDPTDDRIENLQVLTRSEHLEIHRPEYDRSAAMQKAWATRRKKAAA